MRTSTYDPGIHPTLCYYMALAGLTLAQMAEKIGVTDRTLDNWCARHAELKEAIKPGKDFIDNLVEGSLLKRALGYEAQEITRERAATEYVDGNPVKWGMRVTKKVLRHISPEVAACIFWLKNRKGWRDISQIEHSGSLDVYAMTQEQRQARIEELLLKRAQMAGRN